MILKHTCRALAQFWQIWHLVSSPRVTGRQDNCVLQEDGNPPSAGTHRQDTASDAAWCVFPRKTEPSQENHGTRPHGLWALKTAERLLKQDTCLFVMISSKKQCLKLCTSRIPETPRKNAQRVLRDTGTSDKWWPLGETISVCLVFFEESQIYFNLYYKTHNQPYKPEFH